MMSINMCFHYILGAHWKWPVVENSHLVWCHVFFFFINRPTWGVEKHQQDMSHLPIINGISFPAVAPLRHASLRSLWFFPSQLKKTFKGWIRERFVVLNTNRSFRNLNWKCCIHVSVNRKGIRLRELRVTTDGLGSILPVSILEFLYGNKECLIAAVWERRV